MYCVNSSRNYTPYFPRFGGTYSNNNNNSNSGVAMDAVVGGAVQRNMPYAVGKVAIIHGSWRLALPQWCCVYVGHLIVIMFVR